MQVAAACRELLNCLAWSIPCRNILTSYGGAELLVQFAAACNRSQPHASTLLDILALFSTLARDRRFGASVWGAQGCLDMLAAQLQACREHEVRRLTQPGLCMLHPHSTNAVDHMQQDMSFAQTCAATFA